MFLARLKVLPFVPIAPLEEGGGMGERSGHRAEDSARAGGSRVGIRQERAEPFEQGIDFVRLEHPLLHLQR
jgi:hypothetical protein